MLVIEPHCPYLKKRYANSQYSYTTPIYMQKHNGCWHFRKTHVREYRSNAHRKTIQPGTSHIYISIAIRVRRLSRPVALFLTPKESFSSLGFPSFLVLDITQCKSAKHILISTPGTRKWLQCRSNSPWRSLEWTVPIRATVDKGFNAIRRTHSDSVHLYGETPHLDRTINSLYKVTQCHLRLPQALQRHTSVTRCTLQNSKPYGYCVSQ